MTGRVISHWQHRDREVTDVGQNIFQTVTFSNPLTLVPGLFIAEIVKSFFSYHLKIIKFFEHTPPFNKFLYLIFHFIS